LVEGFRGRVTVLPIIKEAIMSGQTVFVFIVQRLPHSQGPKVFPLESILG
jgi:hypothetical protein